MTRLVIELKENGDLYIYSELDVDLTLIDWKEVKKDAEDMPTLQYEKPFKEAERELIHKTTGLKQVYP